MPLCPHLEGVGGGNAFDVPLEKGWGRSYVIYFFEKRILNMNRKILNIFAYIVIILASVSAKSELPSPALIGYWHNWDYEQAPFLAPERVHSAYNIINIAFSVPRNQTDYDMYFHPLIIKKDDFKSRIKKIQSEGKKVILSLGGGNSPVTLDSTMEKDVFVQSVLRLLIDYEFDGLDIDFEGSSIRITGGTIKEPVDSCIVLLIDAIKEIMADYHNHFGRKAILTFAPETAYAQGGQSGYGGVWGAYLPLLDALRDSIDIVQVQLYNSGSMYGLDWGIYSQATADFIIAMTEKMILGFNTKGGFFDGFPANKIAVGLPSCPSAAGGGYTHPDTVAVAMNYLLGKSHNQPGTYKLRTVGGYPDLRGMMTWSINWDASDSCSVAYEFADNFEKIFPKNVSVSQPVISKSDSKPSSKAGKKSKTLDDIYFDIFPNPAKTDLTIVLPDFVERFLPINYTIRDIGGNTVRSGTLKNLTTAVNISNLRNGVYFVNTLDYTDKFIKE